MEPGIKKPLIFIALLFVLSACTGGGGGGGGGSAVPKAANAPANLALTPGNRQITLYWDELSGASSYTIYWSSQSGVTPANGFPLSGVHPGYVHGGLSNGQAYYYVVTAQTGTGESPPSVQASAVPQGVPINSLFTDSALQACINEVATTHHWQYADEVSGYIDCSSRGIVNVSGIEQLTAVTQLNLQGNLIHDVTPIGQLFNLTLLDVSNNSIDTAGLNPADFTRLTGLHTLRIAGNPTMQCNHITQLLSLFSPGVLDVTSAQPGINCSADSGTGGTGTPGDGTPSDLPTAPPPGVTLEAWPTGVRAIPGDSHITVHWYDAIGATSYNIYWSLTPGVTPATGTLIENISTAYVHSGLTNFTPYYYIVTAIVDGVESQPSEEVTASPSDVGTPLAGLFTDTNLQACIDAMAAPNGWTFAHEIVGAIDCSSRAISALGGLENLTELTSINLLNNTVSDVSALSSLSQLNRLYLNNNLIADLTPLSGLSALYFVNLRNNTINDTTPLSGLTAMQQLYLNNNSIIDVTPLSNLTGLTILDLRDNSIGGAGVGHVDTLSSLASATSIRLAGNSNIDCNELMLLIGSVGTSVVDLSAGTGGGSCSGPPGVPQNPSAHAGNQRVIVSWDQVLGATGYNLYWSNSAGVTPATGTLIANVNPGYIHSGLINETPYYYVLTAINSVGESTASAEISATPTLITLDHLFSDNNLQACVDEVAFAHGWTTADQVTGRLNCSMRNISTLTGIENLSGVTELSLNSNSIVDVSPLTWLTGLTSLSIYGNQIINVAPLRTLSSLTDLYISNNMIASVQPLSSLTGLLTLDLTDNQIAGHGVGRIDTLKSLINATQIRLTGNPNSSCHELAALLGSLASGVLDIKAVEEGVNCTSPSLIPTGLRAVSGDGQITISWYPVSGISSYRLYWSTTPGVTTTTGSVIDVYGNSYLHTGLTNDTTYYYVVTSLDRGHESNVSREIPGIPSATGVALAGLIPDANLSGCISGVAGSHGWRLAHEVTGDINCSAKSIADVTGLEQLSAVQSIRLGGNKITDVSALSGLSNVTFIDLFDNQVSDISALSGLTHLQRLYLHSNNISDISVLSTLPALDYLILDGNSISDLSPLTGVTTLKHLFVRNNLISNVSSLSGLTELIELYMNNNVVVDVAPLAGLTLLQKLDIRNNALGGLGVGHIDSLAGLTTVSQIWLQGNSNVSCSELTTLVDSLGFSAVDVGAPIDGVNCTAP